METLPPVKLGVTILLPFAFMLALHRRAEAFYVLKARPIEQSKHQFILEISLPIVAGIITAIANLIIRGFPMGSGLTLILGCLVMGFFLALDMSLARERTVIEDAISKTPLVNPPKHLYSLTRKFTLVAFTATLFVSIVIGLVISRDFFWLAKLGTSTPGYIAASGKSVIYEIYFIMAVLLAMVINIILSYSKNLKLLFNNETDILERVSSGDLSRLVPVVTNDEFGVIAGHTNTMIDGLRHRIQLMTSLELAEEVQQNLLPKHPPEIPGLDISGISKYCDQTGGDYYDYFYLPHKRLGILVADASDHGVGAALHMTTARAFIRFGADAYKGAPQLLNTVNRFLTRDSMETGRFMTAFFLEIDYPAKTLKWVRAGHDPAVLYDPSRDTFEHLTGEGTALGVVEDLDFHENSRQGWRPGSILVIGTDGIWEAQNTENEMFGQKRYHEIIRKHAAGSAADIQNGVIDAVESFQGDADQEDDITLVVIKLL
jgi:phosphoserine phosphatase RsbU/P